MAAVAAAAPIAHANGSLKGKEPTNFDGDRSKSARFLKEFKLYRILNSGSELITNPYNRVALAIGFIKGPKVDDWTDAQAALLDEKTTRAVNRLARTDEALWTEFERDFTNAFTDTAKGQNAFNRLMNLKMQDNDVDGFITTFNHLVLAAGRSPNDLGTLDLFKRGLRRGIALKILNKENIPLTLDEWQEAARKEVLRSAEILASLGPAPTNPPRSNAPGPQRFAPRPRFVPRFQTAPPPRPRNTGPVPMDVDAARLGRPLTEAEKKKLQEEGKCFYCKERGHLSKGCLKKPKRPFVPRARIAKTESQDDASIAPSDSASQADQSDVMSQLRTMSATERSTMFDQIIKEELDF